MQNVLEILKWYKKNFRELPWRSEKDPYRIWLSEVILQQTRVAQGLAYYHAFVSEYPDIRALAAADEEEVLRLWQGLGYYSRARNMHRCARIITDQYHAVFPSELKQLTALPGIGEYTASAILSFAYGKPFPALDGNVYRVLSRLYDIGLPVNEPASKAVFMDILQQMIQGCDPAVFNNAMMELGALVCKPDKPDCSNCPVFSECLARLHNRIEERPVKTAKKPRKRRYFHFYYIRRGDAFFLEKRSGKDIWQHLYQLPMIEVESLLDPAGELLQVRSQLLPEADFVPGRRSELRHVLTHQEIQARFTELILDENAHIQKDGWVTAPVGGHINYPLPVLVEKFLLSL